MSKARASVKGLGGQIFTDERSEAHPVESFTEDTGSGKVFNIAIQEIDTNPDQPRKFFDEAALRDLAESIKTRGLLQPIIVAKKGERYLLVAGERRYRASKMAGLTKLSCIIRSDNPLEIAIIENLQRENLNAIEEAEGLQRLGDSFKYTQRDLAKIVGKSRPTINEILSLNRLPEPIKQECRTSDTWPKSVLMQIARQPNAEAMLAAWDEVKNGKNTVRSVKTLKPQAPAQAVGFTHIYKDPEKTYTVTVRFRKRKADAKEIVNALEKATKQLKGRE